MSRSAMVYMMFTRPAASALSQGARMHEVLSTPAHKQTDPAKLPGQVRTPVPVTSKSYKPTHGGYPG